MSSGLKTNQLPATEVTRDAAVRPEAPRTLSGRLHALKATVAFALSNGASLGERFRLAYYAGFKPALAFRGLTAYSSQKMLTFKIRVGQRGRFTVHTRDWGDDIGTVVEFFSGIRRIIPLELPRVEPKVIYDIGAHIGIGSLFLASKYPNARFYGFEPLPANYNVCALNYENLSGSQAFPWAISSASGTAAFRFGERDLRGGCLAGGPPPFSRALDDQVEVQVRSVQDLVETQKLAPPDFLKIDVEGAEFEVLKGLGPLGQGIRRIFLETHGPEVRARCLDWLKVHDFVVRCSHEDQPGCGTLWCDRELLEPPSVPS